jgi:galactokinase
MECHISPSVQALAEALNVWSYDASNPTLPMGAIVIISHDPNFCRRISFTHVATIQNNGQFIIEQRNTNDNDWQTNVVGGGSYATTATTTSSSLSSLNAHSSTTATTATTKQSLDDQESINVLSRNKQERKLVYNAPKRVQKLVQLIESTELKITDLDQLMLENGANMNKLSELCQQKQQLEAEVAQYMQEWEELETFLTKQRTKDR